VVFHVCDSNQNNMAGFRKFNKSRDDRGFGGSKFGGGRKFEGRGEERRDGPKQLFDATCGECNQDCQVPFRPSGSSPVFCRDCFKKQDNREGNFSPKKSFAGKGPVSRSFGNDAGVGHGITKAQFDVLNMKLDSILSLLRNNPEDEDFFVEKKSRPFEGSSEAPTKKMRGRKK
jgi:CxxC-x17-CxxC domain-containing protein